MVRYKQKNPHKIMTDKMPYSQDPKMLMPVYIRDFLGSYADEASTSIRKLYNSFPQKYCEDLSKCSIKFCEAIPSELGVSDAEVMKFTDELLTEINFEA